MKQKCHYFIFKTIKPLLVCSAMQSQFNISYSYMEGTGIVSRVVQHHRLLSLIFIWVYFCAQLTLNPCAATITHAIERENVLYSIDTTIVITLLT